MIANLELQDRDGPFVIHFLRGMSSSRGPFRPFLAFAHYCNRTVTCHQGFFIRPSGPNRRPPVPVYRTGWTGYRLKLVKLKFEFKTRSYTGFEHLTGRLDRFTGYRSV